MDDDLDSDFDAGNNLDVIKVITRSPLVKTFMSRSTASSIQGDYNTLPSTDIDDGDEMHDLDSLSASDNVRHALEISDPIASEKESSSSSGKLENSQSKRNLFILSWVSMMLAMVSMSTIGKQMLLLQLLLLLLLLDRLLYIKYLICLYKSTHGDCNLHRLN